MTTTTRTASAAPAPDDRVEDVSWRRRNALYLAMAAGVVAVVVAAGASVPGFLTFDNFLNVVRVASVTGIVALGMSFVTISGNFFSLSLEQTAALTAVVFTVCMQRGAPLLVGVLVALSVAAAAGAVQGALVAAGANPVVTTIGAGAVLFGIAAAATNGKNVRLDTDAAQWLGTGRPLGVPTQSWAFVLTTALAWFLLRRTRFGRQVYLVGSNRETARGCGVSPGRVALASLVLSALAAGVVGVLGAAQFGQVKVDAFSGTNINVVAAVLVGGVALAGGQGSPLMPAFGAVFIALLQNFMYIKGISTGVRITVVGAVVVAAVCLFHVARRRST